MRPLSVLTFLQQMTLGLGVSWTQIKNHQRNIARFRTAIQQGRLGNTYLFVGPKGVGKRTFALKLAETLLCETNPATDFEPCGQCPACVQVRSGNHPDLILVTKPKEKNTIPVEVFIGDREHRRQEGLCHDIGLKPFRGGRKIAIIDDADFLNQESANSLLKTLEEPPPKSVLILIGTSAERQLQTIISRSQVIRFEPLTDSQVEQLLMEQLSSQGDSSVDLADIARASGGSLDLALQLVDKDVCEFREDLFRQLASLDPARENYLKTIVTFVDGAGPDAASKRERQRMVADFAIKFYSNLMSVRPECDVALQRNAENAKQNFGFEGLQRMQVAAACISRSIELQRHINANANIANCVSVWLRDLGRICRGEYVESVSMV